MVYKKKTYATKIPPLVINKKQKTQEAINNSFVDLKFIRE